MKSFLLICVVFFISFPGRAQQINVTYISNTDQITRFWQDRYALTHGAAQDLNIKLTIIEGQGHHILQAEILTQIALAPTKPDILIFTGFHQNALATFNLLEREKIPFITLSNFSQSANNSLTKLVGTPQGKFSYWLAEHYINSFQGGYLLADNLINQAKRHLQPTRKLKLLALRGDFSMGSERRASGLKSRIDRDEHVILVQDIISYWQHDDAKKKFKRLYRRHNGIDIVWASSDMMALGALAGAKELGLKPNKNIFIGGFDWNTKAIQKLEQQQLTASIGGNIFDIAWLLVKVYDHFNGIKSFVPEKAKSQIQYTALTPANLKKFIKITSNDNFPLINFYCFSRTYTQQEGYDFSANKLSELLNKKKRAGCL